MRRWILVFFCLLLLAGCGAAPQDSPVGEEDGISGAVSLPVTEEAIRAVYGAEGAAVLAVTPYEGDFLVELGPEERPALDWVFGSTGIRRRLYTGFAGIRDYEILYAGCVCFTTDGTLYDTSYHDFPQSGTVSFDGSWDENGQVSTYDPYSSGMTAAMGPYWAPLAEPASFGMAGRSEALLDARVTVSGLELLFGPMSGRDFNAAFCAPPLVEVACAGNVMTLTCHDTYLDCMALAQGEPKDLELLQQQGTLYPGSFPEGPLEGSNRFISRAEVSQEGSSLTVRLTLTEDAGQYTVSREYQGNDSGPYLRLSLREAW